MFYKLFSGALIVTLLIVTFPSPVTRADGPAVVINELLWMGSSTSSADEWIELRNMTNQPVDISNWQLTKKSSGAEAAMVTIPAGKTLPPNGYFLISNYANTNVSTTLNVVPDVVTTDVALSNSALQIKLYDATHAPIDTADDGVGNPLAGVLNSANEVFASMERNPDPGDGTLALNWHTASRGIGFKDGSSELGTPGTINSNGVPVADAGDDQSGVVGQTLNFDGSDSIDPEGQVLSYAWEFGDGTTAINATPQHSYAAAGAYAVTLTVNDGIDSATDTMIVSVSLAPAATSTLPSEPATSSVTAASSSCAGLKFSELFPNPVGVDTNEFVELLNGGDEYVTTGTCSLLVGTKKYELPGNVTVGLGKFLVLQKAQLHFTLTNSGTTVKLVDTDGTVLDTVNYGPAVEGKTWALFSNGWAWTSSPTPNAKNILTVTSVVTNKTASTKTSSSKSKKAALPPQHVVLSDVQQLDSGDKVIVDGVVTVPVGALGSTVTYIQSTDGGLTVTVPNGEPSIQVGDQVEITGTVHLKQGRRQVAVSAGGLKILSQQDEPTGVTLATDDVSPDQADQLVHIKGVVGLSSGSSIEVDDGSGPVSVYIKSSTGIIKPKIKAGDTVDAVGIVGVSTSGVRILPRSQNDLHVERVLGATTSTLNTVLPTSAPHQSAWYWVYIALGGLVVAARPMWKRWRANKGEKSSPAS